jgi:hypothetical protein
MQRILARALVLFAAAATGLPLLADNPAITVTVDAGAAQHPIDPRIYGSSWASAAEIETLGLTLNRWGGNAMSRYNWAFSTANRCKDYYFYNIPDNVSSGDGSNGKSADDFIGLTLGAGAEPVMTIPMLSLLPENRSKQCSYPQAMFPNQQDFSNPAWEPEVCGNGRDPQGDRILTQPDPNNIAATYPLSHQGDWVQHMIDTHGSAAGGGVRHYSLDNEPHLWSFDHWDVHPAGTTFEEVWGKMEDLGAILRAKDPDAVITGGEEWGWSGYFISGIDAENGNTADRDAHGMHWYPWLLTQAAEYEEVHEVRILDVLTAHFYPQNGEFFTGDTTPAMQQMRNRSTRALWDVTYEDESWIGDNNYDGEPWPIKAKVRLIPRLKQWVADHYPGTKVGITEYNWGDGDPDAVPSTDHINFGTAQADILGIFGREGLDMAVRWGTPKVNSFAGLAFRMYRNYDGNGAKFGDSSVSTGVPQPDDVAAFSAIRSSDGALTVMLVAKTLTDDTPATIDISGFTAGGPIERWQLDAASGIARLGDTAAIGNDVMLVLPPQTVTLLVIPPANEVAPPALTATALTAARVRLTWTAVPGATGYEIERSSHGGPFALLATAGAAAVARNDDAVDAGTTYVYRIRALLGGPATDYSNLDAATTIIFTDTPLTAGTIAKAVHVLELRTAVNAMRAAAGLAPASFTDALLVPTSIRALHFTQLRNMLDAARTGIGLPPLVYTDSPLSAGVTKVKAAHVNELREGVR